MSKTLIIAEVGVNHNGHLDNAKKTKIIIMFDDKVDRSQLKKYSNYNFVVKPFKLKKLLHIITDFFTSYETQEKNIKITHNLICNKTYNL